MVGKSRLHTSTSACAAVPPKRVADHHRTSTAARRSDSLGPPQAPAMGSHSKLEQPNDAETARAAASVAPPPGSNSRPGATTSKRSCLQVRANTLGAHLL